jgi:hypothetical protein
MRFSSKNIVPIIFLTACCGLLLWPTFVAMGILPARVDAYEKRIPAAFPQRPKNKHTLEKWPRRFDNYLSDNIPHRGYLIGMNAAVKYYGFKSSPNNSVMVGKGDWLFHNIPKVNEEIQGLMVREPYQIRRMRITLEERKDWLAERGIDHLVLIAPSKHTVYYDKLPSWIKVDRTKPTRRTMLLSHLQQSKSKLQVFDFTPTMLKARAHWGDGLYYKHDTHWNYRGSLEAYKALSKAYPMWFNPPNEDWTGEVALRETNLMQMMGLLRHEGSEFIQAPGGFGLKKLKGKEDWQQKLNKKGEINIYQNPRVKKKKLFAMGDSFLTWNAQYLAHSFSSTTTTNTWGQQWKRYEQFPWFVITKMKPDLVVEQMVENRLDINNLTSILTDPKGKNHPEFIREARLRRLTSSSGMLPCNFFNVGKKLELMIPDQLQGKAAFIVRLRIQAEGACQLIARSPFPKAKAWQDLCIRGAEMTSRKIKKGQKEIWICVSENPDSKSLEFEINPGSGIIRVEQVEIAVHPDI